MNFEENLKIFKDYVNKYNFNLEEISYKYKHTLRVVEYAKEIVKSENFNDVETFIGLTASLLHDIARFEEWTTYKSFLKIDHGSLGCEILKKNNFINNFVPKKYVNTILIAVEYHNKIHMPNDLDEFDLKILKLVRDADKIDILNTQYNIENKDSLTIKIDFNQKNDIPKELLKDFMDEKIIKRKDANNTSLILLYYFAYLFDINYKKSFKIINELDVIPNHLKLFHKLIINEEQYKIIESKITSYLKSKLV